MRTIAIIAPSSVPFQVGGAEKFWWGLHKGLTAFSGSYAELLKLPCREESFAELVASYHTFSRLDLSHFDMVISTKYPAWMVPHPNHVVYMQHTLRGLYDTYHFAGLPEMLTPTPAPLRKLMACIRQPAPTRDDLDQAFDLLHHALAAKSMPTALFAFPGPLIREVVHFFDRVALAPSQVAAYAAISATVRDRPGYFPPGADVAVLHHPSDITEYCCGEGQYIFTASRLTPMKRVHLIVEAMSHVTARISLKIAGTGPELEHLKALAGDDSRIEFLGYVPDAALPHLYSHALFVPFVPYDEDYGLITIEAMHSGKPVVTTTDAGGVREMVRHEVTGLCVEPTPAALGAAMQRLASAPALATELGQNARRSVSRITWEETTSALLDHAARATAHHAQGARQKILVCAPFPASENISGGQRRLYHLCNELARHYFVHLLCFGPPVQHVTQHAEVLPYFHETRLPWTAASLAEAERLAALTGASADDLALMRTATDDAPLLQALTNLGGDAACVVAAHPYLYPALRKALPRVPLLYDAHNVEMDLKAAVLGPAHADLCREVFLTERDCALAARAVLACSTTDAQRLTQLYELPAKRCSVVPNGCDCATVRFTGRKERRALRLRLDYPEARLALFIGSGHRPNMEAVEHIIHMAAAVPEAQFLVAGSVSTQKAVRELPRPENVHLLGILSEPVKNLLLQAADVGLNPVTSGSGTNLKSIEYVAAGLETVSTPCGMRGLEENFAPCIHINTVEDFPQAIRTVFENPAEEAALAETARRAAQRYAWPAAMRPLEDIVANAIAQTEAIL